MDKRLSSKSIVRRLANRGSFQLPAGQQDLIVDPVVDSDRVCLGDSSDLVGVLGDDLGIAPCSASILGAKLLLKRSNEHESVLLTMRKEMRNRSSSLSSVRFTAEDFAASFGLNETDIGKIVSWMELQGLSSLAVSPNRTSIKFSGKLLAIEAAFSTEFHRYRFEGRDYFTSARDLWVPRALAPVISCFCNLRTLVTPPALKERVQEFDY